MTIAPKLSAAVFIVLVIQVCAMAVPLHAADKNAAKESAGQQDHDTALYYLGTTLNKNLKTLYLSDKEQELVIQGLRDAMDDAAEPLDEAKYAALLNEIALRREADNAAQEKQLAAVYLEKMAAEEGAVVTDSGLVYLEVIVGKGAPVGANSIVTANYHGTLRDGSVFDSSYQRGQPLRVGLNDVIPCWQEGMVLMRAGGRSKVTCPSALAYGDRSAGAIPAGAALTFQIELLDVVE